ncbi:MAG TPA: alpha/beta hydrolase [Alphaproteobacteria bacterium]|nr:alpha/beta hydrolase [Alphaproteobacteria bacterium]
MTIHRRFVDIAEGQMHLRIAGPAPNWSMHRPVALFHGSPGSARSFDRLIRDLAESRAVIAPDTLGQGDSSAPNVDEPDMAYIADAAWRAIEAAWPGFDKIDLFGTHTGARIALEISLAHPERVGKLILDGMSAGVSAANRKYAAKLAEPPPIDLEGTQFLTVFNTLRDAHLFWPYYERDAEHRRPTGLPSAAALHERTVDILKGLLTAHHAYRAAVLYPADEQLPKITVPTLVTCARNDVPYPSFDKVAELVPGCVKMEHPADNTETLASDADIAALAIMLTDWLDE